MRIGLMGCGVVASYGHLPVLAKLPGVELAALYDPSPERVQAAARQFGVPAACTTLDAFFAQRLDAVAITSPAPFHLQNIRVAAAHGAHILCEKPLASTEDEGLEADRMARAAGVMLFTGFDYRFSLASMQIRDLVQSGAIGAVRSLRLVYIWNCHGKFETRPDGTRGDNTRRTGRMLEGGPLVDCGVHQIDLAHWWLASEVVRWTGHGAWVDAYDAPDHAYVHMDHANGAHTLVEISYSYAHTAKEPVNTFTYELIGSDGLIRYDRNARLFELRDTRGTRVLPFAPEKNFEGMYVAFVRALATGEPGDLPTAQDGIIATRIARTATEQAMQARKPWPLTAVPAPVAWAP